VFAEREKGDNAFHWEAFVAPAAPAAFFGEDAVFYDHFAVVGQANNDGRLVGTAAVLLAVILLVPLLANDSTIVIYVHENHAHKPACESFGPLVGIIIIIMVLIILGGSKCVPLVEPVFKCGI
jgi:hypothetical protein